MTLVTFETFDQSDEKTRPDQKYQPTYIPTSEYGLSVVLGYIAASRHPVVPSYASYHIRRHDLSHPTHPNSPQLIQLTELTQQTIPACHFIV